MSRPRQVPFRTTAVMVLAAGFALPASAHDFWLQPKTFWPAAGSPAPITIWVGHGADRQRWGVPADHVLIYRAINSGGTQDQKAALHLGQTAGDADITLTAPGATLLAFQSTLAESELPAIRFNDYIKAEGLTPAIALRDQMRKTQAPGREIYSRRAKVLMQVGPVTPKDRILVTRPVGLSLEIVPERNPYELKDGDDFPVRVLSDGKPLAGASVKLTNLDFDAHPVAVKLSDPAGRAVFSLPQSGVWLVNVIWTKPIKGNPKADFETTFSSFTFGYPRGGMAK